MTTATDNGVYGLFICKPSKHWKTGKAGWAILEHTGTGKWAKTTARHCVMCPDMATADACIAEYRKFHPKDGDELTVLELRNDWLSAHIAGDKPE